MTVDVAREGGLVLGTDYEQGDPFESGGKTYYTAKLLSEPVALTIKVIDTIGYFASPYEPRWTYIGIPRFMWHSLSPDQKVDVVGFHYRREGGLAMRDLFTNFEKTTS